jgi:hypothetical protein
MSKKIGIIQVRGIGDAIIAMPIAQYYHSKHGAEVYFALDSRFCASFEEIFGHYCNFIPVPFEAFNPSDGINNEYWYELPKKLLNSVDCNEIISFPYHETHMLSKIDENQRKNFPYNQLMARLTGPYEARITNLGLFQHLKFDEYKYATAMVPFGEKWNLQMSETNESRHRQVELYEKYTKDKGDRKLIVCHLEGSDQKLNISNFNFPTDNNLVVEVKAGIVDNPFDWLELFRFADSIICIDSFYANLVDQLNLPNEKHFIKRSSIFMTPVFKNLWNYVKVE